MKIKDNYNNHMLYLLLSLGVATHPLFIPDVSSVLYFFSLVAKACFIMLSFIVLFFLFKKIKFSFLSLVSCIILVAGFGLCVISIALNDIEQYPNLFISLVFGGVLFCFYNVALVGCIKNAVTFFPKHFDNLILFISIFLVFIFCLELYVKYFPNNSTLLSSLRETGSVVFPFRFTGFLLDANRWAFAVISLIFTVSLIAKKHRSISLTIFYIVASIFLVSTLSKTAFFIALLLLLINCLSVFNYRVFISLFFVTAISVIILANSSFEYEGTGLQRRIDFTVDSILNPGEARTLNERQETYAEAYDGIAQQPLLGHGYLNFSVNTSEQKGISIHNTLLSLMAYFGVIAGFFFYIFVYVFPFFVLYQKIGPSFCLLNYFIVVFIYTNMMSFAHDLILNLCMYLVFLSILLNVKVKNND